MTNKAQEAAKKTPNNPNENSRLQGGTYVPTFNQNDTQLTDEQKQATWNVIEREENAMEQDSHIPDKNVVSKNTANTLENGKDVTA